MIKISENQMNFLEKNAWQLFENRLFEHFKQHFTDHIEILGEKGSRNFIRYGISKSQKNGFTTERNICIYLSLMFLLGSEFDTDVQLPWVSKILGEEFVEGPSRRIDKLHETAMAYLDSISGINSEYYHSALMNLEKDPIHELLQFNPAQFEYAMHHLLQKIWFHKAQYLGKEIISKLIKAGIETARHYFISDICGTGLFIVIMYILGSGFHIDPQFPWASKILQGSTEKGGMSVVEELHQGASEYLEKWLVRTIHKEE